MGIHNPVGGGPEDPYDKYRKYRVEGVDKDKHDEPGKKKFEEEPQKQLPSGSFLLAMIHRLVDYFLQLSGQGTSSQSEKEVRDNLHRLRAAFETMKWEDRSQDIEFLNALSEIWHQALENTMRYKRTDAFSTGFRSFVKKIQNYPDGEEHSLGYYLTEYTGEKWLPFPYMELVKEIHEQYQTDPVASPLTLWLQELDDLIVSLNPD